MRGASGGKGRRGVGVLKNGRAGIVNDCIDRFSVYCFLIAMT